MIGDKCRTQGHRWRTHRWGHETAYWECSRLFCGAHKKAPWYVEYLKFHGVGRTLPPAQAPMATEDG